MDDDDDDADDDDGGGDGNDARGGAIHRRVASILEGASDLLSDAAPEFSEVYAVRRRFMRWQAAHPASYKDTYIELCLPTLLAPLVRLELLRWRPHRSGSFESQVWYLQLRRVAVEAAAKAAERGGAALPGATEEGEESGQDGIQRADRLLLAQLAVKLALPRLRHCVLHSWHCGSRRQTAELLRGVREAQSAVGALVEAVEEAKGSTNEEAEEAAAMADTASSSLDEITQRVSERLATAVSDVAIPVCIAPTAAAATASPADGSRAAAEVAAARGASVRLARAIRLLGILAAWSEVVVGLAELSARLVDQQVVPYLSALLAARQAAPAARIREEEEAWARMRATCESVATRLPAAARAGHLLGELLSPTK